MTRKMMTKTNNQNGFTLIEAILYIGLLSILISGTLLTAYRVMEGSTDISGKFIAQEEANFLLRKIDWALTGISSINVPSPQTLIVNKVNFSENPITFDLDSGNLRITRDGGTATILNSENILVSDLVFTHINIGTSEAVKIVFNVNGIPFETIKYIRK